MTKVSRKESGAQILFSFECAVLVPKREHTWKICGDYSEEDTPVPIPNTEVKLFSADDTWWETAWESRTLPLILFWSYGQAVKTPPCHGGNPGSSPGRITRNKPDFLNESQVFFNCLN